MPDTARTEAELLSILADNSTGNISAQDLRDFTVSITDPVAGFPVNGELFGRTSYMMQVDAPPPGVATLPGAANEGTIGAVQLLPLDPTGPYWASYNVDGGGWAGNSYTLAANDPTNGWSIEITANSVLLLPTGLYMASAWCYWPVGIEGGIDVPVSLAFDQARFDPDATPAPGAPWVYDGYYGATTPIVGGRVQYDGLRKSASTNTFVLNDKPTPQPYALFGYTFRYTADVVLQFLLVQITKVA